MKTELKNTLQWIFMCMFLVLALVYFCSVVNLTEEWREPARFGGYYKTRLFHKDLDEKNGNTLQYLVPTIPSLSHK